ncbi:MAG: metallophosphoesterase [Lachnospiraceae bacterium]
MTAVYLSPVYLILCIYVLMRMLSWLKDCHPRAGRRDLRLLIVLLYAFLACSVLIAFLLPPSPIQRVMKLISNYWLGTMMYALMVTAAADIVRLILKRTRLQKNEKLFGTTGHALIGALCLVIVAVISAAGIWSAGTIRRTEYEVTIHKKAGDRKTLDIVLVADLHLGYSIGCWNMQQMVKKINAQKPDLVVIAGDIFDNEYEALDDPERLAKILSSIESTYGVYACYGNHDIQEKILAGFTFPQEEKKMSDPRMDELLQKADIHLLRDEAVLIDDSFYVYGRPDYERPGRGIDKRKSAGEITQELDRTKPVIVIDHEPRELSALADAGVDLDLCGHTHDGQLFPGNIVTSFFWENSYGYLKKGQMHNIVTSGVGVFGPNMRVGTKSEICTIRVNFDGSGDLGQKE